MFTRLARIMFLLPFAIATLAVAAGAAERSKKKYTAPSPAHEIDRRTGERIYSRPDRNGWFPHDSNKLKFGSQLWWDQMEREGRLGRRDR